MIKLNPYLNFLGRTEEAFNFYRSVFDGEFLIIQRFREVPDFPGKEKMSTSDLEKLMHVSLKMGDNILMGTDALESQGHSLVLGNNISLSISTDSREEAERLFLDLQQGGGTVNMPLQDMFWGSYFGMVDDRFGIKWMINYEHNQ